MAANATELYIEMLGCIGKHTRVATEPVSPMRAEVREALPMRSFTLDTPYHNLPGVRKLNDRWVLANVLHFFTGSEDATDLLKYNPEANRFLTKLATAFGDKYLWLGAYGAIAMPQLRTCVEHLREHPVSRRAIVTMGTVQPMDANRPACWTAMQLLQFEGRLDLLVFQRSLNLHRVMPYDCTLLCSILLWAAKAVNMQPGKLRWTIGNLHTTSVECDERGERHAGVVVPYAILNSPEECTRRLRDGLETSTN